MSIELRRRPRMSQERTGSTIMTKSANISLEASIHGNGNASGRFRSRSCLDIGAFAIQVPSGRRAL
jgi:hypothetical protein